MKASFKVARQPVILYLPLLPLSSIKRHLSHRSISRIGPPIAVKLFCCFFIFYLIKVNLAT